MVNDFEELKQLLRQECNMVPSDDVLDSVLALGDVVEYGDDEVVTEAGSIEPYIYIVKEGILSISDMDGTKERTVAFACPGTICTNKHSFVKLKPSYYQIEACGRCVLVRIPRDRFFEWIEQSHEGAIWLCVCGLRNCTIWNSTTLPCTMARELRGLFPFIVTVPRYSARLCRKNWHHISE